jgi:hypothetical protein
MKCEGADSLSIIATLTEKDAQELKGIRKEKLPSYAQDFPFSDPNSLLKLARQMNHAW